MAKHKKKLKPALKYEHETPVSELPLLSDLPRGNKGFPISKYMTPNPITVQLNSSIAEAESLMQKLKVRHLPVLDNDVLEGIVTDRDLSYLRGLSPEARKNAIVRDAYMPQPYVVSKETSLYTVCEFMAESKFGYALIVEGEKLVGVFTWVDGLRALATLLKG